MVKWWKKFFPEQPKSIGEDHSPAWIRQVAMLTGILAGFAGYLTVRSTELSNDAIYQSNQAVLKQVQASDMWAQYQAESIKARVVESLLLMDTALSPEKRAELQRNANLLRDAQNDPKKQAMNWENARDEDLGKGSGRLNEKDFLGYAGMAVQLAIALASVAALTRRRGVFNLAIMLGIVGIGITGYAFWFHYHYLAM